VTERRQPRADSFSVMVPAPSEQAELEATLARLLMGDDPPSEVLVVVGDGDTEARGVAEKVAACHPGLITVVDEAEAFEPEAAPSFTVMVPAPREQAELETTLARLLMGDNPPSEVLVVVADGDAEARSVAEQASDRHPRLVTVVDEAAAFEPESPARPATRAFERAAAQLPRRALRRGGAALAIAAGLVVVAASIWAGAFVFLLYVGASLALAAIAWTTLVWMLYAWRTPAALAGSRLTRDAVAPAHSFSLIVPARHEQAVLEGTLSRLAAIDHPNFEVLVVVGSDDAETREVAERVAARHPDRVSVVVDASWPKSKPRALNAALPHCSGEITGVFDAEDDVHPAIVERVDQCFQNTNADVVQAGVQLMNFRSSWLTVRNVLEYYFWFRSRLHFHASAGFIPLGGNTVFVRTQLLRAVSGWDPDCLAEDCELGVRLSALGAKTVVFYEPELVTREECPPTLRAFARQRTRWNQGYLQTLAKGHWRRLGLRQRALGFYVLAMPYLMAVVWLTIPVAIATALTVKAPVPITLISFFPALPMLSMLAVEVVGLGEFCRTYGERASARDYLRLVLGVFAYQSVLAFAAVRAVVREARGDRSWEKTQHLGLHLAEPADAEAELAAVASSVRVHNGGVPQRARARARVLEPAGATVALLEREHEPQWEGLGVTGNGNGHRNGNGHQNGNGHRNGNGHLPGLRIDDAPETTSTWLRSHADLLLLAALLAGVGFVQATNMLHWPDAQFDEGTYVSNAWAVQHGALAPYTYSYGHPPLAWLLISLWTWARGLFADTSYSIDTGRQLMFVVTLVSCSLVFILARRLGMGRAFAAAAVLLFALSPVGLFFHRAVLLDNIAMAWVLAAFVLAWTPRQRLWAYAGSGACFAAALLSKETTLVLLPALLLAAWQNMDKHTRRYCVALLGSFLGVIALSYPLYAALKGELLPGQGHVSLLGYAVIQLVTREATGSLFDPQSQTHAIVMAWLQLDPWLLGLALALSPLALARRSTRAIALAFLIQVVMILRPGYLPNMYVIGLLPFAALIVSGAIETLWRRSGRLPLRVAIAALAIALLISAAPHWARSDETAMAVQVDGSRRAAERWLVDNIGHHKRLIVPDEYWIHLIENGFDRRPVEGGFFSRTVVVYWPLDYDPAVKRHFPDGWRDFDYVVSTQAVRSTLRLTPTTARALDHSVVIAQFGQGEQRIEIRAIRRQEGSR
jgi:glycosyltransferase XagB